MKGRTILELHAQRRAAVLEQRNATSEIGRAVLQLPIDAIDQELEWRREITSEKDIERAI